MTRVCDLYVYLCGHVCIRMENAHEFMHIGNKSTYIMYGFMR